LVLIRRAVGCLRCHLCQALAPTGLLRSYALETLVARIHESIRLCVTGGWDLARDEPGTDIAFMRLPSLLAASGRELKSGPPDSPGL